MQSLYDSGAIDENTATFWFGLKDMDGEKEEEKSLVTLGGMPENCTRGETFTQYLNKDFSMWWTTEMDSIKYGDEEIKTSNVDYTIIDSGTSLLYLPYEDYQNFKKKVKAQVPEFDCDSDVHCFTKEHECDKFWSKMSDIKITLSGNTYTMPPEAYAMTNFHQKKCAVAISYSGQGQTTANFGDTFMRSFVTTYDYGKNEMRLAVNINAVEGVTIES